MAQPYEVFDVFLTPMKRLFARPLHNSGEDESAVMGDYLEALKVFSKPVLEAAWRSLREGYAGRFWPPVAVCLKACRACQQAFREDEKTRRVNQPQPVAGRMVDGAWQPWNGCRCARCEAAHAFRSPEQRELDAWYASR